MNSVDFVREGSRALGTPSTASRISSKAQKESYNAFLVSDEKSQNTASSNKEYSLSDHFSGDRSEGEFKPRGDEAIQMDSQMSPEEYLFFSNLPSSLASDLMQQAGFTQSNLSQEMPSPQLKMQVDRPATTVENNSPKWSDGKSVLPQGLQLVSGDKMQAVVQQVVPAVMAQSGTLDAQKHLSMYRPITSADLTASKRSFSESTFDVRGVVRAETAQAVSAATQNEHRQGDGDRSQDDSRKQQQSHPQVLNSADIQTRIDPVAMAVVEQQSPTATTARLQTMGDMNPVIMEHMDRLLKSQQKQLKVKLELPDGEILSLKLKLDNDAVQVHFESGSEELLNSLAEGWGTLEEAAREKGVVMAKPQFETSPSRGGASFSETDDSSLSV